MDDGDFGIWQLYVRVQGLEGWVIPLAEFAEKNVRKQRTREFQLAWLDAVDIDDRNHAADNQRKLTQAEFCKFVRLDRHVGRAEVHRASFDLGDPAARSDGLVSDDVAGGRAICGPP